MARMISETVTITVSKLVKDHEEDQILIGSEVREALEEVTRELSGSSVLVEVE